jgi:aryl-alcohol dehydrogenase
VHGHFFGQSSFATHTAVTQRAAVKAGDVPLPALAPFGCGVQTGAGAVFRVAVPQPGSDVAVFGAGGVGLSAVMAARLTPAARIIAVDVNPRRLRLAADLGATHTVNSADADAVDTVRELTAGGADVAIETGRPGAGAGTGAEEPAGSRDMRGHRSASAGLRTSG